MAEAAVEDNLDPVPNFVPSPEVRASIQIQLIGHTQVVGAEQNQEDLRLYFLSLRPENITTLQQLLPELTDISPNLMNAQTILGIASEVERTRSEANRARVIAAINAKGEGFLHGLERYRLGAAPIQSDNQKMDAILNFFAYGKQICQHDLLRTSALNVICNEYLRALPLINGLDDTSNKLILSKISKSEAYAFASQLQDALDSLGEACTKYYSRHAPEFQNRDYAAMREVFAEAALIEVGHSFEDIL